MLQRIWDYSKECWSDEDVLADGEMLRVPLMLCDGAQQDVRDHFVHDHFVRDALARHNANGFHRPGFAIEAFVHAAEPTVSVVDASDDLVARRGVELRDAFVARERALNEVGRRQQWRTTLDARLKVEPESDDGDGDGDESNGELAGSAEYPGGDYTYEPDADDNDDDDDPRAYKQTQQHGSEEYPRNRGRYPDGSVLTEAERAYQERTQRGDQLWRTGSAVSRANANQAQLERWRGK
jgi:hypothetical protein